jgi:transposase-like protein
MDTKCQRDTFYNDVGAGIFVRAAHAAWWYSWRMPTRPVEVVTDRAAVYPRVLDELAPRALRRTEQYANNRVEADHGQLKRRLRPMRGLKTDSSARVFVTAAFAELALAI